ncbi:MAG: DUF3892 domain-containing protein [Acidimicrobiia bacterium]
MKRILKWTVIAAAVTGVVVALRKALGDGNTETETEADVIDLSSVAPSKKREVTATGKADGHVTTLVGPWGTVSRDDAIEQIRSGEYEYYVAGAGDYRVQVIDSARVGAYLRTEPGGGLSNNLDQLPDA